MEEIKQSFIALLFQSYHLISYYLNRIRERPSLILSFYTEGSEQLYSVLDRTMIKHP